VCWGLVILALHLAAVRCSTQREFKHVHSIKVREYCGVKANNAAAATTPRPPLATAEAVEAVAAQLSEEEEELPSQAQASASDAAWKL